MPWVDLAEDVSEDGQKLLDMAVVGDTFTFLEQRGKQQVKVSYKIVRIKNGKYWSKVVKLHKPDSKYAKSRGVVFNA